MAAALAEHGHRITVFTLSDGVDGHDDAYPFRGVRLPRRGFKPWRWLRTGVTLVRLDRKSTRLNSSHANISYAVFCLKKNKLTIPAIHQISINKETLNLNSAYHSPFIYLNNTQLCTLVHSAALCLLHATALSAL